MLHKVSFVLLCLVLPKIAVTQVTIGSNTPPHPSAVLDLQSNQAGFLLPRLTTVERNGIATPSVGLMIYNTTTGCVESYFTTGWKTLQCECLTAPVSPSAITGPAQVCPGTQSVQFSIASVPDAGTYVWTIDGQDTLVSGQGSTAIAVNFSGQTGSRQISVLAQNGCGSSAPVSQTVLVSPLSANFTVTPNPILTNTPSTFTALQGNVNYAWTFPSGSPASGTTVTQTATWSSTGTSLVNLTVNDAFGCTATKDSLLSIINCQPSTLTFSNCGATGRLGPTQSQCNSTYGAGVVTVVNGIQEWVVPAGVTTIDITARGASGGNSTQFNNQGGRGAIVSGRFSVTPGETLRFLVGQSGTNHGGSPSGGGGTYAARANNTPLIVAGGGGGGGAVYNVTFANATSSDPANRGFNTDRPGPTNGEAPGGTGGNGGNAGRLTPGGGGFFTNGATTNADGGSSIPGPGISFINGGNGGTSATTATCGSSNTQAAGGFGGGGGAGYAAAGAGGGYSGGGGTDGCNPGTGGGGSSFNAGTNQSVTTGSHVGHGQIQVTIVCQ
jgi:hypothetical protein